MRNGEMTLTTQTGLATLLRQYDRPGPRYTSYPTAVEFNTGFGDAQYRARLEAAAGRGDEPLSLYAHLPFCRERCSYCGCMVIITQKREVAARYLDYLEREIAMLAAALGGRRRVVQHHWGGGTPTYLDLAQIERLDRAISRAFHIDRDAEKAIEIDPRVTTREQLVLLRQLGFNRLSMGIQDFTAAVQEAINRGQSEVRTRALYEYARGVGFDSINVDLIYGLPRQSLDAFRRTLASVVDMRPDRIAVYSYAHVPWLRPHQRQIDARELPDTTLKFELFGAAVEALLSAGYTAIGMDHFALPGDELAAAAASRRLHRNFMGYTTRPASDMVGVGVSAIGDVRGAFAQNHKKLPSYYAAIDAGLFPVERGYALSEDDRIRRYVITELMCNFHVSQAAVLERFGVEFARYFDAELAQLGAHGGPVDDGFVTIDEEGVTVTGPGRLFVRNICMAFDSYLPAHQQGGPVFSRTI
jgi:oxygen-independent coproporphyrinogen III oxidase